MNAAGYGLSFFLGPTLLYDPVFLLPYTMMIFLFIPSRERVSERKRRLFTNTFLKLIFFLKLEVLIGKKPSPDDLESNFEKS